MTSHNGELKPFAPDEHEPKYAHFRVNGKDPAKFAEFRERLLNRVMELLDKQLDSETGSTVKDELKELTCGLLDYAKSHLAKPGLENQVLAAEAAEKFANAKKAYAQARRTNADAAKVEFELQLTKLELFLKLGKAQVVNNGDETSIIFGNQIDAMLSAIADVRGAAKELPGS